MENDGVINAGTGVSTVVISLDWPFEQGDDELDTEWGEAAYDYYNDNINEAEIISISLKIELIATQIQ